jgi:hypothetical protein
MLETESRAMQNARSATYVDFTMPRGWLILGLALAAWVAAFGAWQAVSFIFSVLVG